jgi:hypothetical protein
LTDLSRFFPFSAALLWHNHPFAIWALAMIAFQELEMVISNAKCPDYFRPISTVCQDHEELSTIQRYCPVSPMLCPPYISRDHSISNAQGAKDSCRKPSVIFLNSCILHHSVLTTKDKEWYAMVPIQLSENYL